MKSRIKDNSLLGLHVAQLKSARALDDTLRRWGINRGKLTAFLAGAKEIPYAALLTISLDVGIPLAQLLRDYATAGLLKVPEVPRNPREYPRTVRFRLHPRAERSIYKPGDLFEPVTLRAFNDVTVGSLSHAAVSTGFAFETRVVIEWHQADDTFYRTAFGRLLRGEGRPGYLQVDIVNLGTQPKHIKEGTILGHIDVAVREPVKRLPHSEKGRRKGSVGPAADGGDQDDSAGSGLRSEEVCSPKLDAGA